ncbi:MAG: recombination mediator RecR [Treponema sp.]|nr:recombination mediator RecR [Treponema sp.]
MNIIDELTGSFSRLPGIGKKSASRIVNHLLKADPLFMQNFSRQIIELQQKIKPCPICGAWTEREPCDICSNPVRDHKLICVVEQPQDVQTIENAGGFTGLYHVLGGVIAPLEGIGPDQLNIATLINRVQKDSVNEVIIATNPTFEGDATALYLQKLLAEHSSVKVTRLATGIPVGGDLEYADKLTLARSFRGRSTF